MKSYLAVCASDRRHSLWDGSHFQGQEPLSKSATAKIVLGIASETIVSNPANARNIGVVPEFPVPLIMAVASIASVIVFVRLRAIKGQKST